MGVLGGVLVAPGLGFPLSLIFHQLSSSVHLSDIFFGTAKGVVFGAIVSAVGCLRGLQTQQGPTQPSYIVVEFEMRDNVTPLPPGKARSEKLETAIKQGLRARLKGQGITGTSILSLEYLNPAQNPPAQIPWIPKHTYIPAAPGHWCTALESSLTPAIPTRNFWFHQPRTSLLPFATRCGERVRSVT